MTRQAARLAAAAAATCALLLAPQAAGAATPAQQRVAEAGLAYFAVSGSAKVCGHLSARRLAKYGSPIASARTGTVAACRQDYALGDAGTDFALHPRDHFQVLLVAIQGARARVHYLWGFRSFELVLVREHGAWKVDFDDDEIASDSTLVGISISATEHALDASFIQSVIGEKQLVHAIDLTGAYIAMVRADRSLSPTVRTKKLHGFADDARASGCSQCAALLSGEPFVV